MEKEKYYSEKHTLSNNAVQKFRKLYQKNLTNNKNDQAE